MKNKILDYIEKEFSIDVVSYMLISELYDNICDKWGGFDIIKYNNKEYKISAFVKDFVETMNNCRIDLTIEELIDNDILDIISVR